MSKSSPKRLNVLGVAGNPLAYHLPYVQQHELVMYPVMDCVKFSVARCARVSYLTHDKKDPTIENDIKLFDRLVGSTPMHASPTEHQARPMYCDLHKGFSGNFSDEWLQFRKLLEIGTTEIF